ncbi:MAG: hypothetical protein ACRDWN_03050, partial [Acidimicrobiales bacterium]
MPFSSRRRHRVHASTVLVASLVVLAVLVLVGGLLQVGTTPRSYWRSVDRSFAAQGAMLVDRSNRTGAGVRELLGGIPRQSRTGLQSQLDMLARTSTETARAASALAPPALWGGLEAPFTAVLSDRARAVARLRAAVDGLLGASSPPQGTGPGTPATGSTAHTASDLGEVGALLEGADRSYGRVRQELARAPGAPHL